MNNRNISNTFDGSICNLHDKLCKKYPLIDAYESRAAVWGRALKDQVITKEEYNSAKEYFGTIWNYVGD